MFATDDTIVAIATPLGRSGLGIVRLSGPASATIARDLVHRTQPFVARQATLARLRTPGVSDEVIVTVFVAPHSYTGEEVAEISVHGSPMVLQGVLREAISKGARLAEPGEFTLRAFLNGKLDLVQAEAVGDLIEAVTPLQARAAFDQLQGTLTARIVAIEQRLFDLMARLEASLDFPDEGYHFVQHQAVGAEIRALTEQIATLLTQAGRGRLIREGASVAIVGTPNVGKSSVFNALLNAERAIVTPIPGTTRDLLTERADIRGLSVGLVDTAGLRDSTDLVEQEGIARARRAADAADLMLVVLDRSRPLSTPDRALIDSLSSRARVLVANKSDLPAAWAIEQEAIADAIEISSKTGEGLPQLIDRMAMSLGEQSETHDDPLVTNVRHIALLESTRAALHRALGALSPATAPSEEFILADLQEAASHLQEITGKRTTDDLLRHIFERFCIGK
ncbi:MAG TPA: tRNA uridine-5-carboxymethylaminomethyl(34) synthesis GTPase MnmE [Steroidobacter sp.]|jgi:tRNA modification GTPase|nr:tRNA uridine-5-carboxymethylaminomethyl(34) synthesis GTPase MnmE [Steroidobacter sp.]